MALTFLATRGALVARLDPCAIWHAKGVFAEVIRVACFAGHMLAQVPLVKPLVVSGVAEDKSAKVPTMPLEPAPDQIPSDHAFGPFWQG